MKRTVLLSLALMLGTVMFAQINPHALGLRFGGGSTSNAEITYQRGLGSANRLEVDLGLASNNNYSSFSLIGVYQWVWAIESGFSWYAGVGGGLGSVNWDDSYNNDNDGFWLSINGQVGIEYQFSEIPLQLSLDTRPGFAFGQGEVDVWDVALGIRYTF
jgi:hypothetical protein